MALSGPIRSLSPEAVAAALAALEKKYQGRSLSADDSRAVLAECIAAFGGLFAKVSSTTRAKEWWFFRIRKRSSFTDEADLLDPKQYSYVPAKMASGAGRCHLPYHPVLYAADSYDGAIGEMKTPNETDYMLAVWRLSARPITPLKFLCGSNIREDSRLHAHKTKILSDACLDAGMEDEHNGGRLRAHVTAWSDLFMAQNQSLSACIAHQCVYGDFSEGHDLVAYGSAIDGSFINFAIPPKMADQLELYRIFHIEHCYNETGRQTTWVSCADPPFTNGWRAADADEVPGRDPNIPTKIDPYVIAQARKR